MSTLAVQSLNFPLFKKYPLKYVNFINVCKVLKITKTTDVRSILRLLNSQSTKTDVLVNQKTYEECKNLCKLLFDYFNNQNILHETKQIHVGGIEKFPLILPFYVMTKEVDKLYQKQFIAEKYLFLLKRCIEKNFHFDLTISQLEKIYQRKTCYYTNVPIDENTRSLDRLDNNKGYVKGNLVLCHKDINELKSLTFELHNIPTSMLKRIIECREKGLIPNM